MTTNIQELELADWRRRVAALYAAVRDDADPERGHALWRAGRDQLFQTHAQSPLPPGDRLRDGLAYWPYDASLRFESELRPVLAPQTLSLPTGSGETTTLQLVGHLELPSPVEATIAVWRLAQYAGGLFVPLRDGTAGESSYGGGRYALDTAKGADLGGGRDTLIVDLNFLYHPSCRYDDRWQCPLAPPPNSVAADVRGGERL
jgi:uncharacterized protein (DUF1684 family)